MSTLKAKMNLAILVKQLGERDQARTLYEQCAAGYAQAYGPQHSKTIDAQKKAQSCN